MLPKESLTAEFDEVEVRIFRGRTGPLRAELRLPNEERLVAHLGSPPPLTEMDPRQYGRLLFDWLFQDQLRDGLRRVRWQARSARVGMYSTLSPPGRESPSQRPARTPARIQRGGMSTPMTS